MDREAGIQAIVDLQKMAGITETREQAETGWDGMRDWERQRTMEAHRFFFNNPYCPIPREDGDEGPVVVLS